MGNLKPIVVSCLVFGVFAIIASMVIGAVFGSLFPELSAEYMSVLFRPWGDPWMSAFFPVFFVEGFVYAWFYDQARRAISSQTIFRRGAKYGAFIFLMATIPGMLMTMSSFNISALMVFSWVFTGFIQLVVGVGVLAVVYEKME